MKKLCLFFVLLTALGLQAEEVYRPVMRAVRVKNLPFSADLTAGAWKKAPAYSFYKAASLLEDYYRLPQEKAAVKLLYDDRYFYVGAKLQDSEITSTGTTNQTHLYAQGDVVEVFLKPENQRYYWEIYGTPGGLTSCFYFRSRGVMGLPSAFGPTSTKIKVISKIDGTFNNWRDRDKGWHVLIAIPLKELRKNGLKFTQEENWTILVARYNYSRYLNDAELSVAPQIIANFHCLENYARLKLE